MTSDELTCRQLVELVTDFLEDRLPPAERARVGDHLRDCPGCRAYLDQMRKTVAALGRLPAESLSGEARAELREAFRGWNAGR